MKIDLKLSTESLLAATSLLSMLYGDSWHCIDAQQTAIKSIGYDVFDKFDSKAKAVRKNANLFTSKKTTKIALKHHEAWALEKIMIGLIGFATNEYCELQIQTIIDVLNQKLA